jgi:hypothetical protein
VSADATTITRKVAQVVSIDDVVTPLPVELPTDVCVRSVGVVLLEQPAVAN